MGNFGYGTHGKKPVLMLFKSASFRTGIYQFPLAAKDL